MNTVNQPNKILASLTIIFFITTLYFGYKQASYQQQTNLVLANQITLDDQKQKTVDFLNLFIEKVLKSDGVVDFEARLQLETSVRDLKKPEIIATWQNFIDSQTEIDAQKKVRELLEILAKSI